MFLLLSENLNEKCNEMKMFGQWENSPSSFNFEILLPDFQVRFLWHERYELSGISRLIYQNYWFEKYVHKVEQKFLE